jgi:PTH1 family peptidyl-tRNA hydrolase
MIHLIAALGNPGPDYAHTRHNAGWILVDAFASSLKATWKAEAKFNALVAKTEVEGHKVYLIKPLTYMNLSGEAVVQFLNYHKFSPESLLLIHDDIAFESGVARLSLGGSGGGHNGVTSVMECLGTEGFWRLRLGMGPKNPLLTLTEWVLGPLSEPEKAYLSSEELIHTLHLLVDKGPIKVQNDSNLS